MRKIVTRGRRGRDQPVLLNGEPLFQFGPLDQGFWPDGLYTAPTDEALRYDIEVTRALGFNMARKHVKVEPARWYYWCDGWGCWSGRTCPAAVPTSPRRRRGERRRAIGGAVRTRARAVVDALQPHPSIVMWVPFNEGWGQYDTARLSEAVAAHDPTRLVNSASGWNDLGAGDIDDVHSYPGPGAPERSPGRASVLGEFGGFGLPVPGHTWQDADNWGYRFADPRP